MGRRIQKIGLISILFMVGIGGYFWQNGVYKVHAGNKDDTCPKASVVNKKGDHIFNNIAKAVTNMILDVFRKTNLRSFIKVEVIENRSILIYSHENKDVTDRFPKTVEKYSEYKNDELLTTGRDKLSVHGQKHVKPDDNSEEWGRKISFLNKRIIKFIDKAIECSSTNTAECKKQLETMNQRVQDIISEIKDKKYYVDNKARDIFKVENINNKELRAEEDERSGKTYYKCSLDASNAG